MSTASTKKTLVITTTDGLDIEDEQVADRVEIHLSPREAERLAVKLVRTLRTANREGGVPIYLDVTVRFASIADEPVEGS